MYLELSSVEDGQTVPNDDLRHVWLLYTIDSTGIFQSVVIIGFTDKEYDKFHIIFDIYLMHALTGQYRGGCTDTWF